MVARQRARYRYGSFSHGSYDPALPFSFEFFSDDVREPVLEKAATGIDNDPGDDNRVADAHQNEEEGLLKTRKLGEVDGSEAGHSYGTDTVEECVDKGDGIQTISGIEYSSEY
jgi:hypothetical protein